MPRRTAISADSLAYNPLAVAIAAEAVAHAHLVNDSARKTVRAAGELVKTCGDLWREYGLWRQIWAELEIDHDPVVAICAYCQRVRTPQDEWEAIPDRVKPFLGVASELTVTHGICPDCVAEHFPMVGLRRSVPG